MGSFFDITLNLLELSVDEALYLFFKSDLAYFIQQGNPHFINGRSGAELVSDAYWMLGFPIPSLHNVRVHYSPEYWAGWALAYYQWWSGKSFEEILSRVPFENIIESYYPLHEAPIQKFVREMDEAMEVNTAESIPTANPVAGVAG